MKRAAVMLIILATASLAVAQTQQQAPNKSSSSAPGAGQTSTPPAGKLPPQAKTQAEFDAYSAAVKNQNDPAAMDKAAEDFAAKFPESELRVLLYRAAMHAEQSANNAWSFAICIRFPRVHGC